MKKIFILFLCIIVLSSCHKNTTNDKEEMIQNNNTTELNIEINQNVDINVPELSEKDIDILNNIISTCTKSTAFEDANFEYEFYYKEMEESIYLRLIVIKPMKKVMDYYDTNVDGLIQTLKRSLTFDMFLDLLRESELSFKNFSYLEVRFDDTKDDTYSFKFIKNE